LFVDRSLGDVEQHEWSWSTATLTRLLGRGFTAQIAATLLL